MPLVLVGVSGGIAAYKVAPLIRLFSEAGYQVKVLATKNSLRFIGATTLEALSKNAIQIVDPDLFTDVDQVKHVKLGQEADLVVVAPATASLIAKMAAGIADDLLTTTLLATRAPIVIAPAMHTEMWENSATVSNIKLLKKRGIHIVAPGVGRLTGNDSGAGRLAEPEEIFSYALSISTNGPLAGKRIVVTAGGTRESIDTVRYIGNYSSGKQGIAFAKAAMNLGAEVKLIAANIDDSLLEGIKCQKVSTTAELKRELDRAILACDLLIMAAAVADFRPKEVTAGKIHRSIENERIVLELVSNPDLLKELVAKINANSLAVMTIGFAAEAAGEDFLKNARTKFASKGCDYLVANDVSEGKVFGSEQNAVVLFGPGTEITIEGSKLEVANAVLKHVADKL